MVRVEIQQLRVSPSWFWRYFRWGAGRESSLALKPYDKHADWSLGLDLPGEVVVALRFWYLFLDMEKVAYYCL